MSEPTHKPLRDTGEPLTACWRVPPDLPYFNGHFPGFAILSGVAQLHEFVLPRVEARFPDLPELRRIRRLKFRRPIRPGDQIALHLERAGTDPVVRFRITRDDEPCTSGTLIFAAGGCPGAV